ncbi:MAG: tetratricopeptide repeat protein [Bacteroidetes bacterium]|nr:tetratricopeptide repeat protein [Bacteroidota bacterium]
MKSKLILSIACATGLALSSCNSGEPQKTTTPTPAEQPAATQNDALPANDMSAMEAALAQDSTNIQLRTQVAANYYNAGDLNKAAYHFSIVRMIDPKNLDALKNLGNINYDAHKDEAAIHFYEEALQIQPDDINMRAAIWQPATLASIR